MNIQVIFLSLNTDTPARGYWDMAMLEDLLNYKHGRPLRAYEFEFSEARELNKQDGAVVVLPARAQAHLIKEINEELNKLKWCLLFLVGDEEQVFDVDAIEHPNIKIYVMTPKPDLNEKYGKLYNGYAPALNDNRELVVKDLDWFLAGQITHKYREQAAAQLRSKDGGVLIETQGFTQGLEPDLYFQYMNRAKVAPAPSGPESPDTFRLYEALEMGAVPIPDEHGLGGYWTWLLDGEPPFPVIKDYDSLSGYIDDAVENYPAFNNRVLSWWVSKKKQMIANFTEDIARLSGERPVKTTSDKISVLVPVSPIKSHPDPRILNETLDSVIHHLPDSQVYLTFDGVRPEQEDRRADYEEFIRRVLWQINNLEKYKNVTPLIFESHNHQSGMAKEALKQIKTPLILYMEQDTPLVTDYVIPWQMLAQDISDGVTNLIRFHFEAGIPEPHQSLMLGKEKSSKTPLLRTIQWSQRPHLASRAYYERILNDNFSPKARCFVEDLMHSVLQTSYNTNGLSGWHQHRIHIFYPEGNIKRSFHTDGREGGPKYDDSQRF